MAPMRFSRQRLLALGLVSVALAACAPTVATRGNLVDDDRLASVRTGVSTRDEVAQNLGTPSATGTFDEQTWYYIGQRTEKTAFFQPEVTDRRVVVVHFDTAGVVDEVKTIGMDEAREVEVVDRTTPTAGHQLTLLEQMLGNVGKFSPSTRGARGPTGTTRRPY
ncbi:MAG TPA: outer membrane protein assembly factor BamE [Azospirillaceae bacterium]|nr:outer membrane protein assembly factor BamE [Azospirillaceae bacterium]